VSELWLIDKAVVEQQGEGEVVVMPMVTIAMAV